MESTSDDCRLCCLVLSKLYELLDGDIVMDDMKPKSGYKFVRWRFGKEIEIPEEWVVIHTSEIFEITMGQSPSPEFCNQHGVGLPFYQGVTDFGSLYPTPTTWCTKSRKTANKNSILFAVRAPVGEINITTSKCAIGRGIAAIFCNKSDLTYSYYLLVQNKKHFHHLSQGTIFEAINREHIIQVRLPYSPDKREQSRITSILSGVDAAVFRIGVYNHLHQTRMILIYTLAKLWHEYYHTTKNIHCLDN